MLFEIMHLSMIKRLQVVGVIPDMTGVMDKVLSNNNLFLVCYFLMVNFLLDAVSNSRSTFLTGFRHPLDDFGEWYFVDLPEGTKFTGAAGGDRTHFWVKPLETPTNIGLRKIQQVKKRQQVDDLSE